MTAAFSRTPSYRSVEFHGERTVGGPLVYIDNEPLDKRLDVHREAPGGFDWGPEAETTRACQLAIALLAAVIDVETAVESYHLFAENVVRRELINDSWTMSSADVREAPHEQIDGRDYPPNTTPTPDNMPALETIDLSAITVAEEVALATKYEDRLWDIGDQRESLQRLKQIRTGTLDPATESVRLSTVIDLFEDIPTTSRRTLVRRFDSMGILASWIYYGDNHAWLDGISTSTAHQLREARPAVIQYFGGEDHIPDYETIQPTLIEILSDDEQQLLDRF